MTPAAVRSSPASAAVLVIEPKPPTVRMAVRQLRQFRPLLWFFLKVNMQRRYQRTVLGWIWIPLRLLLTLGPRILIFGGLFNAPSNGIPYPLFLLLGYGAWEVFGLGAYFATRSLSMNKRYLKRFYVPPIVLLVASAGIGVLELMVTLAFLAVAIVAYAIVDQTLYLQLSLATLLFPVGVLLLALLGLMVGTWTAVTELRVRDPRFLVRIALGFWTYLTPVIYPLSAVPEGIRPYAALNPVTAPIEMIRHAVFGNGDVHLTSIAMTVAVIVIIGGRGLRRFVRSEARVLDLVNARRAM